MLQQILAALPGLPVKERLNERCLAYLRQHGVPQELIGTLDECAHAGPVRIGPASLSRLAEVDLENQDDANAVCMDRGFLIVGSGLNGDPIAVELVSGKMAFLSHDLLWEKLTVGSPWSGPHHRPEDRRGRIQAPSGRPGRR